MAIDSFTGKYRFLSNFFSSPVIYQGIMYSTVENAYQAAKVRDTSVRLKMAEMKPADAKRFARDAVANPQRYALTPGWDAIKIDIMYQLLERKFAPGSALADLLLKTGDESLIEGNTWNDRFWGVCRGRGENHLGLLLMRVRRKLRQGY